MIKPNIAPYSLKDVDQEINDRREEIQRLESLREQAQKRESAARRAAEASRRILEDSGLSMHDLYEHLRGDIRHWITRQAGEPGTVWEDLRSHFILHGDRLPKRNPKPRKPSSKRQHSARRETETASVAVPTGIYTNPYSGEIATVTDSKTGGQPIQEWVQRYGVMTVENWRKDFETTNNI